MTGTGLTRDKLSWTTWDITGRRDFYRFPGNWEGLLVLKLGEYESEIVRINVQRGLTSTPNIEFVMPVTKEEALQDHVESTPSGGR